MKKITLLFFTLFSATLFFACQDDKDSIYGPIYDIDGLQLKIVNNHYYSKEDSVNADEFKIEMILLSDNEYAQMYGINPRTYNNITELTIILENTNDFPELTDNDVSKFFVIDDNISDYEIYESIEEYTSKKEIRSLTPRLIFTNKTSIKPGGKYLITKNTKVVLSVKITLDNKKTYTDKIGTVLLP